MRDKKTLMIKLFTPLFILISITANVCAQTALVTGSVKDAEQQLALPGATVQLKSSSFIGSITDINGDFQISNVPIGTQEFLISFIGFEKKTISVEVDKGGNDLGEILLLAEASLLGEVVVSAQIYGQQAAIQEQRSSDAIVNIVSADKIQELPDVNAAEAISRLPGVAVTRSGGEANKVIIRGLSPKFAAITINGIRLPSNSSSDRSVDLSLISPELLSGIEVYKSPLPNMDAESTAGSVNLKFNKAPENLRILAKGLGGYNNLAGTFQDYKGVLQLSNRLFQNKLGLTFQLSSESFNRSSESIDYGWEQESPGGFVNNVFGTRLNLTNEDETRKRTNTSVNLDYDLEGGNSISLFGLYSNTTRDRQISRSVINRGGNQIQPFSQSIENNLSLYNLNLTGNHPIGRVIIDWAASRSLTRGETPYNFGMRFFQEATDLWEGGVRPTEGVHPREYIDHAVVNTDQVNLERNTFEESSTEEIGSTYALNATLPVSLTDKLGMELQFGGKYYTIDRDRDWSSLAEHFYYLGGQPVNLAQESYGQPLVLSPDGSRIRMSNFTNPGFTPQVTLEDGSAFVIPFAAGPKLMRNWYETQKGNLFNNLLDIPFEKYSLTENVLAFYVMAKLKYGEKLTIIPGVRYEKSDNSYNGIIAPDRSNGRYGTLQTLSDTTGSQSYDKFFPHLHAKYEMNDWLEFRFSYANTIARPDFVRLIPAVEINRAGNSVEFGNTALKPMMTESYDFSFSLFKNGIGFLSGSAFYKNIDNLFISQPFQITSNEEAEQFGLGGRNLNGYNANTSVNISGSKVYGYEIDLQSNLAKLPMPFSGVVFNINFTRLYSETTQYFARRETEFIGSPPVQVTTVTLDSVKTTVPNQVPWILRASLGYDFKGFSFRISSTYQGDRLRGFSIVEGNNSFDQGFWRHDIVVKQNFAGSWSAFLNLNNISNQQDVQYRFSGELTRTTSIQTFGATGQIGIQYKFRQK